MAEWLQDFNGNSVEEIVEKRTGRTAQQLLSPNRNPVIEHLDDAVSTFKRLVKSGESVTIVADYDCDGDMSGTILHNGITEYTGIEPETIFPMRKAEGYGLSAKILDRIKNPNGILITVDNGITAVDTVAEAKKRGYTVIILDHHLQKDTGELPNADVIVDPHVFHGEFDGYCGAGLALKFVEQLVPSKKTFLKKMRVLAGIATVADVMELIEDNRNIVREAIEYINTGTVTTGLKVLLEELKLSSVSEDDFGYKLGPVFNAAGRLRDDGPEKVFQLIRRDLKKSDPDYESTVKTMREMAKELIILNGHRQDYAEANENTARMLAEEKHFRTEHKAAVFWHNSFFEGINGVTAGRMAEYLQMPCFVFSESEGSGMCKGSARSFGGIHMKNLLDSLPEDIFEGRYGGHAGAAGMAISKDKLDRLQECLDEALKDVEIDRNRDVLYYDLEISADQVPMYVKKVRSFAPYGEGNPPIIFKVTNFEMSPRNGSFSREMGKNGQHIKLYGKNCDAICFYLTEAYHDAGSPIRMDLLGSLSENNWRNQTYNQVEVIDFHPIKIKFETKSYKSLADLLDFD